MLLAFEHSVIPDGWVLSVPVAAIGAFHHCGHGRPCNPQDGAFAFTLLAGVGLPAVTLRAYCDS